MDPGVRSALIDFFRRGDVVRDVRLLAAKGAFAPSALDQLALLLILLDDSDPEVAREAAATVDRLPREPLEAFLGRSDVTPQIREFFAARGVIASGAVLEDGLAILDDSDPTPAANQAEDDQTTAQRLALMGVMEKVKVATRGTREERGILIRDPNRLVAAAVLSSPKLTDQEVEGFAKMANVTDEVLRVIGANRHWTKNYGVVAGLVRNPKTPLAISMNLIQRVNDKDIRLIALDRNVPEPIRIVARKRASENRSS
jgi:hypothetical protein